jgi:DNA end-binding protein Ku
MARAIWTGSIGFGLVNVPVGLYSATEDHTVHFHQFEKGSSNRIRYQRVNESTGQEVDYDDIVQGWDAGDGQYVIVTADELEDIAPGPSRTIEISDFVDQSEIDPIYFQKTYYLAPQDEGADRPYSLLLAAMAKANRVGIATFVMRGKQYLCAVRAHGDVLALETMFFADEIRDPRRLLAHLPGANCFQEREVDMAISLIESMTVPWDPDAYQDTYRERVMELIEAKRQGREVVVEGRPEQGADVVDLMEALERSLATARRRGRAGRSESPDGSGSSGLSRHELYQRAQELDVAGRSRMSKDELEQAVREAS